MGYPTPAIIIGGSRKSLRCLRRVGSPTKPVVKNAPESLNPGSHALRKYHMYPFTFSHEVGQRMPKRRLLSTLASETERAYSREVVEPADETEAVGEKRVKFLHSGTFEEWGEARHSNTPTSRSKPSRVESKFHDPLKQDHSLYQAVNAYIDHFAPLLKAEYNEELNRITNRLSHWSIQKLLDEGYMRNSLSAYPYEERAHSEYTYSFIPPAGSVLGNHLFTPGVQVTIVSHEASPLDFLNQKDLGGKDSDGSACSTAQLKREVSDGEDSTVASRKAASDISSIGILFAVVVRSTPTEIRVKFKKPVHKNLFPANSLWRIDLGLCDIAYLRMDKALDSLNYDPAAMIEESVATGKEVIQNGTFLRNEILDGFTGTHTRVNDNGYILTDEQPSKVPLESFIVSSNERVEDWAERYSQCNPVVKEGDPLVLLNAAQIRSIALMFKERISLIQGPPGTGKSRTVVEAIRLLRKHFGFKQPILICAYTNATVDNLVEGLVAKGLKPLRVGSEERVREDLKEWTLQAQYETHKKWDEYSALKKEQDSLKAKMLYPRKQEDEASTRTKIRVLARQIMDLRRAMDYDLFRKADVVCTTCLSAGSSTMNAMDFPVVFLDEASMPTEPASLIPLMRGSRQLALIGDHEQLPPVVASLEAQAGGLSRSLFERLIESKRYPTIMLDTQYRMHPTISAFPSSEFYGKGLKDGTVLPSGKASPTLHPPQSRHLTRRKHNQTGMVPSVLFIHHDYPESAKDRSKANYQELGLIVAIIEDLLLLNPDMKGSDIGIIAPYVAQIRLLNSIFQTDKLWEDSFRDRLGSRASEIKEIEVKTVDGFEGREKEIIIFSTVRNNTAGQIGFLADRRRMNVALTRAKRGLFILGNMNTLAEGKYGVSESEAHLEGEKEPSNGSKPSGVVKRYIKGTGEWKRYIQFVLAENLFIELVHPEFDYRDPEQVQEFERLYTAVV